jgi:Tfp pilus assembly protein PilX
MIRTLHADPRRGYTLTIVLVFLILLFALWTTVYRTTSSLLRIETNRILQQTRDQSAINALAQAVQLLEYGKPSSPGNPSRAQFTYGVTETVPNADGSCGAATLDYTVVYTYSPTPGDPNQWQVQVSPGTYSVPLPQIASTIVWP